MVGQERLPIDAGLLVGRHHPRGALRSRLAHLTGRRLLLLDPLRFLRDHLSGERGRLGGDALARRRLRTRDGGPRARRLAQLLHGPQLLLHAAVALELRTAAAARPLAALAALAALGLGGGGRSYLGGLGALSAAA